MSKTRRKNERASQKKISMEALEDRNLLTAIPSFDGPLYQHGLESIPAHVDLNIPEFISPLIEPVEADPLAPYRLINYFPNRSDTKISFEDSGGEGEGIATATRLTETERLDPSLSNNSYATAQVLPLGFDSGEVAAIDVLGSIFLDVDNLPVISTLEDDGSILLANETDVISGGAVSATGVIGDGPFGTTRGDFDFFAVRNVNEGDVITANVTAAATGSTLDSGVMIFDSFGELVAFNNDGFRGSDSDLAYVAEEDGDYFVVVTGAVPQFMYRPANPFESDSGFSALTTGPYEVQIGLNIPDPDFFAVELNPGDILSVDVRGSVNNLSVTKGDDLELIGSTNNLNLIASDYSPTPKDGNASLTYVADAAGRYYVRGLSSGFGQGRGVYEMRFRVFRPVLESEAAGAHQILFLDFDGAELDTNIFLGEFSPKVELSPMSDFLANFELDTRDENDLIDAIIDVVHENFVEDMIAKGNNPNFKLTILNSRDHADPYGDPNVSRIIVGGTQIELGIPTVGIAQSVDVGNFNTEETGVVLLDALSEPATGSVSLNRFLVNERRATKVDLVARGVGNIVTHEAGHFFGDWHTDNQNDVPNIMDTGGYIRYPAEVGQDGILGTQDDIDLDFVVDEFEPTQLPTGTTDSLNNIAMVLTTGQGINGGGAAGGSTGVNVTGVVWNDANGNGVRDAGEGGMGDQIVYLDVNGDNRIGIGEPAGITFANGQFTIMNAPQGSFALRQVVRPGFVETAPLGGEHIVSVSNQTLTGYGFAVQVGDGVDEGFDYGSAPAPYPTAGVTHGVVANFQLGNSISGEAGPSSGDDNDGVSFLSTLIPGSTASLSVSVENGTQSPGVLQGWIDFDGDGSWDRAGEQIFTDVVVVPGVNNLTFQVPTWAVETTTYARLRYGYERGISYTGAAIAGEVEDYAVTIERGGPDAANDSYTLRRNSQDNRLQVMLNDSLRLSTSIVSLGATSNGGTVEVGADGVTLLYSPATNFSGTETFTYTVQDVNGLSDTAVVSIFVQPDLVTMRLAAVNDQGVPISQVAVGDSFRLQGIVQDLREDDPTGVFAAYMDIFYDSNLVQIPAGSDIEYNPLYPNQQSGDISNLGLIDEVGAFDGLQQVGGDEIAVFSIPMIATNAGVANFMNSPADVSPAHDVLLFNQDDPIPTEQIEYRSLDLVITDSGTGETGGTGSTSGTPLDVNRDNVISPIDALMVINYLNLPQPQRVFSTALDVSRDGDISPIDALLVINQLNLQSAEGESMADAGSVRPNRLVAAAVDSVLQDSKDDKLNAAIESIADELAQKSIL
ncbi:MAG: pre-peptidase C-terminal domain-containing protein [Planctomycetales bacterium]|nr:pre-peptidase C-terminal domain-containing protein [Planctomycetales bacterium]